MSPSSPSSIVTWYCVEEGSAGFWLIKISGVEVISTVTNEVGSRASCEVSLCNISSWASSCIVGPSSCKKHLKINYN